MKSIPCGVVLTQELHGSTTREQLNESIFWQAFAKRAYNFLKQIFSRIFIQLNQFWKINYLENLGKDHCNTNVYYGKNLDSPNKTHSFVIHDFVMI